ncbi:phosphodiester glycosidase family protein [Pseudoalteromonas piscicida]|nr:phosphodiester glycosidase family protein [Pseudoalteromonas piscicida]
MKHIFFILATTVFFAAHASYTMPEELSVDTILSKENMTQVSLGPGVSYIEAKVTHGSNSYILVSKLLTLNDANDLKNRAEEIFIERHADWDRKAFNFSVTNAGLIGSEQFDVGYRVIISSFPDVATAKLAKLESGELNSLFTVNNASYFPGIRGPQLISILKIKPKEYRGRVIATLANGTVKGTSTVSSISKKLGAFAGVNGGYFSYSESLGIVGDPAGISVIDGMLVSEAVHGRPALLINNNPSLTMKILPDVTTSMMLSVGDKKFPVNGLNRKPGKKLNCGYIVDEKLITSSHDSLCLTNDELIVFNDSFGDISMNEIEGTFSILIDDKSKVVAINPSNLSKVPPSNILVIATGSRKLDLFSDIDIGTEVIFSTSLKSGEDPISLNEGTYLVNGGPSLLFDGKIQTMRWEYEGWSPKSRENGKLAEHEKDKIASNDEKNQSAAFFDSWVNRRHPRTLVGIASDGEIYIVVVYGRDSKVNSGVTVYEAAKVLLSLGATSAINLDGGGSSVMVIDHKLTGLPSDTNGERAVADAILLLYGEDRESK